MGRKPVGDQAKDQVLKIRLTGTERAILDGAAGEQGTSTWARSIIMKAASKESGRRKKAK